MAKSVEMKTRETEITTPTNTATAATKPATACTHLRLSAQHELEHHMLEVLKVDVLLQVSAYHHPSLVRNLMTNTVLCGLKSTQSLSAKSLEVLKSTQCAKFKHKVS